MKIGLVTPYPIDRHGGVQDFVNILYKELVHRGHDVRIITPATKQMRLKCPDHVIPLGGVKDVHRFFKTHAQLSAAVDTEYIDTVLAREKFDVLHFHEPWIPLLGLQVVSRSTCANVGTFHAKIPDSLTSKTIVNALIPYGRSVVKYLHATNAVSDAASELITGLTSNSVQIIPNCIELEKFMHRRSKATAADEMHTILFVGRLEKRKSVKYLIKAFAELVDDYDNVQLLIAGDGPEREELEHMVEEYDLPRVKFLGFISDSEKVKLMREADVFCSPARFGESFGIVLLEAMAAGAPVVAGDNPGYVSVLQERGKLALVDAQDTVNFARRLELFLFDQELASMFVEWAQTYVQQFDHKLIVDAYEELYKKAIEVHAGTA